METNLENSAANLVEYKSKGGRVLMVDRKSVKKIFGIKAGSRVVTPKGNATVIGISNKFLWFHIDGEAGATYWDTISSYEDLLRHGIWICEGEEIDDYSDDSDEEKASDEIIQNENENIIVKDTILLSNDFENLLKTSDHSDVEIVTDNNMTWKLHKSILCARSKYFESMFRNQMKEQIESKIHLHWINSSIFEKIVKYIYCGSIETKDLNELLKIAHFFQIISLEENIMRFVISSVQKSNVFLLLSVGLDLNNEKLIFHCKKTIENKAHRIFFPKLNSTTINSINNNNNNNNINDNGNSDNQNNNQENNKQEKNENGKDEKEEEKEKEEENEKDEKEKEKNIFENISFQVMEFILKCEKLKLFESQLVKILLEWREYKNLDILDPNFQNLLFLIRFENLMIKHIQELEDKNMLCKESILSIYKKAAIAKENGYSKKEMTRREIFEKNEKENAKVVEPKKNIDSNSELS